jgi:hypothetical protein
LIARNRISQYRRRKVNEAYLAWREDDSDKRTVGELAADLKVSKQSVYSIVEEFRTRGASGTTTQRKSKEMHASVEVIRQELEPIRLELARLVTHIVSVSEQPAWPPPSPD